MSSSNYRPRLSADLRPDQAARLVEILPHGWQKPIFQAIVDGLIALYDKGGHEALSAIMAKHISVRQVVEAGVPEHLKE